MIKILEQVEKEKNIPAGLLKKIYDLEHREVHKRVRDLEIPIRQRITEVLPKN